MRIFMKLYKRLLKYLMPYKMRLIWAAVFMGLTSVMIAGQTYLVKPLMDKVIIGMDWRLGRLVAPALIIVTVLKGFAWYVRDYLMGYVGQKIVNDIRDQLYAHVMSLSFPFFTRTPTGVIMSRITNDVNLVQGALTRAPASLVQGVLTMLVLTAYIINLNWRLASFAVIVLPLAGFALSRFGRRFRKASTQMQEQTGVLTSHLHETVAGVRIVKAFGMEEHESRRFAVQNKGLFNSLMRSIKATAASHPVMEVISMSGTSLVLVYGLHAIIVERSMSPGDFLSFMTALIFFYRPLKDLNGVNNIVQEGMAAAKRIFEVLDTEPEIREHRDAVALRPSFSAVEFKNVSFKYEDDMVLKQISLAVRAGETLAIVGKSGGGKTTLVNLIPRFYDVTDGAILIDGTDIRNASLASLRALMAVVTQQTILFNDTVRGNIAYGRPDCSDAEVRRAAEAAYAHEFISTLPKGYDTIIGESGAKLSGGQRQRVAIARALLKDAPILILDEATSSLDTESEREVQGALDRLMKGRTSFVIAHRLSTIMNADRIIVLKNGKVIEEGRHEDLLKRGGEYKHLYEQQFRDEPPMRVL
ncbi:MAG: lipid A export permease/ATP-binding protein MsbA [Nitrospirae bacterium GWC2_57_13]|nr:MAG: lipid A export permease/ATP-binding protein MsbA [Nitrospirae bacterium GWC2_57_13]